MPSEPPQGVTPREYARRYRRILGVGLVGIVAVNFLDMTLPLIVKRFIDGVTGGEGVAVTVWCASLYLLVAVIQACCRFTWRIFLNAVGIASARDVRHVVARAALFRRSSIDPGEATTLATSDAEAFARAFDGGIVSLMDGFLNVITVPFILFYLDAHLACWVLLPLPFVTLVSWYFDTRIKREYSDAQRRLSPLTRCAEEAVAKLRTIRVNTAERLMISRFTNLSAEYLGAARRLTYTEARFAPTMELLVVTSLLLLTWAGGRAVISGATTLGTFTAFYRYIEYLLWPLQAVALSLALYRKSRVSGENITRFAVRRDEIPSLSVCHHVGAHSDTILAIDKVVLPFVTVPADASLSFSIKRGEKVAIVGPVGSGKSTLLWALADIRPHLSGTITLMSSEASRSLREVVSLVPQEVLLFGMTVRDNLLIGLPSAVLDLADDEIMTVLDQCAIRQEVEALPHGLDTILGERGWSLSGGQRQRLTLARALIRRPSLLLLDNALSAVDADTEAKILANFTGSSTALLCVTHRLSTVRAMQRVLVMEHGVVTEAGPPADLITMSTGWFRAFVDEQVAEQEYTHYVEQLNT